MVEKNRPEAPSPSYKRVILYGALICISLAIFIDSFAIVQRAKHQKRSLEEAQKSEFTKGQILLAEGEKTFAELYRNGKVTEAQTAKLHYITEALEHMEKHLWDTRGNTHPEETREKRPWMLLKTAEIAREQAALASSVAGSNVDVLHARARTISICEEILEDFPGSGFPLQKAAEILLEESWENMTSPDAYLERAQRLREQVGPGFEVIRALSDISLELSNRNRTSSEKSLAASLADLAMELDKEWYPSEYQAHPLFHQSLLAKGLALTELGQLQEAQELLRMQTELNPTVFPTIRQNLERRIQEASLAGDEPESSTGVH